MEDLELSSSSTSPRKRRLLPLPDSNDTALSVVPEHQVIDEESKMGVNQSPSVSDGSKTGTVSRRVSFETVSETMSNDTERQRALDNQFGMINERLSHILHLQTENAEHISALQSRQMHTEMTANTLVSDLQKVVSSIQSSQNVLHDQNERTRLSIEEQQKAVQLSLEGLHQRDQTLLAATKDALDKTNAAVQFTQETVQTNNDRLLDRLSRTSVKEESVEANPKLSKGRDDRLLRNRPPETRAKMGDGATASASGANDCRDAIPKTASLSYPPPCVPPTNSVINVSITEPPRFREDKYEMFRKDILWWRDLNIGINDHQLCAALAIKSEGMMKSLMIKFMEGSRMDSSRRTIDLLLQFLDDQLAKSSQEITIHKIGLWSSIQKKQEESYRAFWLRWDKLHSALVKSGMCFTEEVDYYRALAALNMRQPQLGILLGTMESCLASTSNSIEELRRTSIKLFDTTFLHQHDEIFQTETGQGSDEEEESHSRLSLDGQSEDTVVESFIGQDGDTYEVRKIRPKKKSNKSGNLKTAWGNTRHSFNYDNRNEMVGRINESSTVSKTPQLGCIRCGSNSHTWRRCHLPYQRTLAFPAKNNAVSGNPVNLASTNSDEGWVGQPVMPVQNKPNVPGTMVEVQTAPNSITTTDPSIIHSETQNERLTEEEWITRWNDSGKIPANICVTSTFSAEWNEVHITNITDCRIVLDSGATHTVVGRQWLDFYFQDKKGIDKPRIIPSKKTFKFGDSRLFRSAGSILIPVTVPCITDKPGGESIVLRVRSDIVDTPIPLLLSRQTLKLLKGRMDFEKNLLQVNNTTSIQLVLAENGHLMLPSEPLTEEKLKNPIEIICVQEETERGPAGEVSSDSLTKGSESSAVELKKINSDAILKLHRHLAHLSAPGILRILTKAGKEITIGEIRSVLERCICVDQSRAVQRPVVKEYIPPYCGHTLFADICYPTTPMIVKKQQCPYLILVCGLSRFCVCRQVEKIPPSVILNAIIDFWFSFFGRCQVLISDKGPGFVGEEWAQFCSTYNVVHVGVPTMASHSNGLVERQVSMVKEGYRICRQSHQGWSDTEIMRVVLLARNVVPAYSSGIAPITAMTGRNDLVAALEESPLASLQQEPLPFRESYLENMNRNMLNILHLRMELEKFEAKRIVAVCLGRQLRADAKQVHFVGEFVEAYFPGKKMWETGYRIVGIIASHCLLDRGEKLIKHPLCWVRSRIIPGMVSIDEYDMVVDSNGKIMTGDKLVPNATVGTPSASLPSKEKASASNDVWEHQISVSTLSKAEIAVSAEENIPMSVSVETSNRCLAVLGKSTSEMWWEEVCTLEENGDASVLESPSDTEDQKLARELQEDEWIATQDPSRIMPRIFLKIPRCIEAIVKEVSDLVRVGPSGVPSLAAVSLQDARFRKIPKAHSTLIAKRKNPSLFKARLCVRGDQIRHINEFSTSAPTASRISSKLLLTVSRVFEWPISLVDISQAFLQSDLLSPDNRLLIFPPDYIPCPWNGSVDLSGKKQVRTHAYLTLRPLYGTKCAPLRWYTKLNATFVKENWIALSTDPCMYRYFYAGKIEGMCITHVDDILFSGSSVGMLAFQAVLKHFVNSGIITLSTKESLVYLGLDLQLHGNAVRLSQSTFAGDKLSEVDLTGIVKKDVFIVPVEKRRTIAKQMIGSLLWITQTRLDMNFAIAVLASTMVESLVDVKKYSSWMRDANKIVTRCKGEDCYINFVPPLPFIPKDGIDAARWMQLFMFVDASFGALPLNASLESFVLSLGKVRGRNGDITVRANILDFGSKRIYRVCKSSVGAECVAISNGADLGIWVRILTIELLTGVFLRELLDTKNSYSITSPFGLSPSENMVRVEMSAWGEGEEMFPGDVKSQERFQSELQLQEQTLMDRMQKFEQEHVDLVKLLLLTDSANAYASLITGFPNTTERALRIVLAYTRNLLNIMAISFVDKDYNLADSGTKSHTVLHKLLDLALKFNFFKVGFMGRKWIAAQRLKKREGKQ